MIASIELRRVPKTLSEFLTIIRPETLIRWHRSGFRCYWRWKSGPSGGRPPIEARLRALIRRMSMDNPCMGLSLSSAKFTTRSCFHLLRGSCKRSSALMARQTPLCLAALSGQPPRARRVAPEGARG